MYNKHPTNHTYIDHCLELPDANEAGKRNMIITDDGQIEFVSNSFIVDAEYRSDLPHKHQQWGIFTKVNGTEL